MFPQKATYLVTGGAGFIGCNLVNCLLDEGCKVVVLDKLTYAGNLASLRTAINNTNFQFIEGDIVDRALLCTLFKNYRFTGVFNLAAESHVDRSIDAPADFIKTNIEGTFCLLEAARAWHDELKDKEKSSFRFLHVSTDEVFGSLGDTGAFTETTPYAPNSPYSASKASADHLVRAWYHTYGLPVLTTNCSNNYGPFQFPEKLIPHMILSALQDRPLPLYGDGKNVRDWLYVQDHCRAILAVLKRGLPGATYNIGGNCEMTNLEIVHIICDLLDSEYPRQDGHSYHGQIVFVADRPGHDRRYAVDSSKIKKELGWMPEHVFEAGIKKTISWYMKNADWIQTVTSGSYQLGRLGMGRKD